MSPIEIKINQETVLNGTLDVDSQVTLRLPKLRETVVVSRIDDGDDELYRVDEEERFSSAQTLIIGKGQDEGKFMIGDNTVEANYRE